MEPVTSQSGPGRTGSTVVTGRGPWWQPGRGPGLFPYLLLLPFLIVYCIFLIYPVINAFLISLQDRIGVSGGAFVGLDNYRALLADARYLEALRNTALFALSSLCILSPLALALALAVRSFIVRAPDLKSFYRVAFFLPYITSYVVIALMFSLVFQTDYGLLNAVLGGFGISAKPWLREDDLAFYAIVIVLIWTYLGLNSLYFLAGLQNIPEDLSEAAALDGASRSHIFWQITLPLLRPTLLFVIVQATIFSFQIFEIPFLLTNGGPSDSTLTLAVYLYEVGFRQFNMGYASAIGYSMALISVVLSGLQLFLFRRFNDDTG